MSDEGEFVINTHIKEHPEGGVTLMVIQPRTVQQVIKFNSMDAWQAFTQAVDAFSGLVPYSTPEVT